MDYPKPITNIEDLPKRYEGLERERFWQLYWLSNNIYKYNPDHTRENVFSVDTPPPTVSGALHIGHVYSYTQTDFTVRYQRMRGKEIFYPFGFDDNGLPSERLVERTTERRAHEVGREEFIKLCKPILEDAEQQFKDLWQSLALSCDWDEFYTTIDDRSRAISQASFIDLYKKGFVYRKEAPTLWCWADQTAIAQAEIEDKEVGGHFHDITFHFDDGSGDLKPVTIATTRPELIPACVAVFAHPDDERYQHLFGKTAITPLFNVRVPVLPSVKADPEKGTGILMCCTFGDMDDVEHWGQFNLPTRVIIDRNGTISDFSGRFVPDTIRDCRMDGEGRYSDTAKDELRNEFPTTSPDKAFELAREMAGQKIKKARAWIREKLEEAGLMTKVEDIMHIVRHSERGGVPIEILVTPQWYINLLDHKDQLIEQGRKVTWHPEYMFKRYEHWVEGLNQDWCISRQRYNGVPFPVWYDADGEIVLASVEQLPVNPLADKPVGYDPETGGAGLRARLDEGQETDGQGRPSYHGELTPEPDVMDTWATSSVSPLLNTHLRIGASSPEVEERHNRLFPYSLRPQAHDIIRTWAFYTIAKSYYHFGEVPWKDIVISGHAQDAKRQKISKSKGHVVTPAEMVEKYTADNLRYWSSGCKLGTDTIYDEKNLTEGKRLINKIFNATKFALRHLLEFNPLTITGLKFEEYKTDGTGVSLKEISASDLMESVTYPTDRWILERLRRTIERATKANEAFEFGDARQVAEDFFWADFCDNYLELSKGRLYQDDLATKPHGDKDADAMRHSAQSALFLCLSAILKLFAPVLPHICEECWSWYHAQWTKQPSLHKEPWPPFRYEAASEEELKAGNWLVDIVALVRKWKSEQNVSLKKPIEKLTVYVNDQNLHGDVERLAGLVRGDLMATCNALAYEVVSGDNPAGAVTIEGNLYAVDCVLLEEEETGA